MQRLSLQKPDKTTDTVKATTDKNGVATIDLVRPTPDEATVTATAKSTAGKDVTSPSPAHIVWYSTDPDQLTLDIGHGVRVPVTTVVKVTATYTGALLEPERPKHSRKFAARQWQ
jgi:hypothetical protein